MVGDWPAADKSTATSGGGGGGGKPPSHKLSGGGEADEPFFRPATHADVVTYVGMLRSGAALEHPDLDSLEQGQRDREIAATTVAAVLNIQAREDPSATPEDALRRLADRERLFEALPPGVRREIADICSTLTEMVGDPTSLVMVVETPARIEQTQAARVTPPVLPPDTDTDWENWVPDVAPVAPARMQETVSPADYGNERHDLPPVVGQAVYCAVDSRSAILYANVSSGWQVNYSSGIRRTSTGMQLFGVGAPDGYNLRLLPTHFQRPQGPYTGMYNDVRTSDGDVPHDMIEAGAFYNEYDGQGQIVRIMNPHTGQMEPARRVDYVFDPLLASHQIQDEHHVRYPEVTGGRNGASITMSMLLPESVALGLEGAADADFDVMRGFVAIVATHPLLGGLTEQMWRGSLPAGATGSRPNPVRPPYEATRAYTPYMLRRVNRPGPAFIARRHTRKH